MNSNLFLRGRAGLRILASGQALPSRRVTSEMLDTQLGKPTGWAEDRSGVQVRYFAGSDQSQSALGAAALKDALDRGGLRADSIDLLISACGVAEQALPNTAALMAGHAGLQPGTPAFDVGASCLSFLVALQVADGLLAQGFYRRIAIVSADLPSRGVDWADPESSLIFGDGAAAVVVERGLEQQGLRGFCLETYPQGRRLCELRAGGSQFNPRTGVTPQDHLFHMEGKAVLKLALQVMPGVLKAVLQDAQSTLEDIDLVVPHQASGLGLSHAAKRVGVPEDKIVRIFEQQGNQVAASLPSALHHALCNGRALPGHRLLMMGTAAGLTVGAVVLDL